MDINNFTKYKKSIQMKLPICNFDVKTGTCLKCKSDLSNKKSVNQVGFGTMCGTKNKGGNIWKMDT